MADLPWQTPKRGNIATALGKPFDAKEIPPRPQSRIEYALAYAALGWAVFPCHVIGEDGKCSCGKLCDSPGKHPLTKHGVKDASDDSAQIADWWGRWPGANIAVACGEASGILVMDIDPRNGGDETLEMLTDEHGPLPDTITAMTGGGGEHYIFEYQGGKFPRLKGIDFQGEGKYIIVEPSNHISGEVYGWEGSSDPLEGVTAAPIPAWIAKKAEQEPPSAPTETDQAYEYVDPQTVADLRSALNMLDADDRDTWIATGHRLKALGAIGRELWMTWSQTSDKWQPKDARKWTEFRPSQTGYQAVFRAAQDSGWVNPLSGGIKAAIAPAPESMTRPDKPLLVRGDQFAAEIKPIKWLVKGYIEQNCMMQLFGPPGSGKSFLAIDWALSIATGRNWQGQRTEQSATIYIAGEGQNGLARRVQAWCKHFETDLTNQPIYFSTQPIPLLNQQSAQILSNEIQSITDQINQLIGLIVIDTLARNFGDGDENSTKDMGQFIHNLTINLQIPFNTTVMLVHHSGHKSKDRARGSSNLPAALDINYAMTRDDNDIIALDNTKMKDGPEPDPIHFGLNQIDLGVVDEDGEAVTSCTLTRVEHSLTEKKTGGKQRDLMGLFDRLVAQKNPPQIHFDELRREAISAEIYSKKSLSSLKRGIDGLVNKGMLINEYDYLRKPEQKQ